MSKTFEIDVEAMFTELRQDIARSTPSQALPKAGYGKVIDTVPLLHEGAVIAAETKEGSGYVTVHVNMSIGQWREVVEALKTMGAHIGDKSVANKAGFVTRIIALPSPNTDTEF